MPPKMDRERELFFAYLELPQNERNAWLDRTCSDDPALRDRLIRLGEAHARLTSDFSGLSIPEPGAAAVIDRYRIIRPIGEGGMGTVYEAEQMEPVQRRVAIKVTRLLPHAGENPDRTALRFAAELQMLAAMDHPNVAKVFDAGTTAGGQAFFAMELVSGASITDYCEDHGLDMDSRVRLFLQLCRAVEHAHQKGITHRDLKPSNVLVGGPPADPAVKVIDFGVARAMEGDWLISRLTMTGRPVGTIAWMSPEQAGAAADVDTRSDVYSLGVILYELAAGVLPADPDEFGYARFLGCLATGDLHPAPPSTKAPGRRAREVRGDLDWIALRALHPDRVLRYQSVSALAEDLERLLAHRPVSARSPTLAYRARTFVRRNQFQTVAAAVAVLAIAAGTGVAAWNYMRAIRAETLAREEAAAASEVSEFLVNTFKVNDPGESRGRTVTARELLDSAAVEVQNSFGTQPRIRQRLLTVLSQAYFSLGLHKEADALSRQAVDRLPAPGNESLQDASALIAHSKASHVLNRVDEAREAATRAGAIRMRILGARHPEVADAFYQEAHVLATTDKFDRAMELMNTVLSVRQEAFGEQHIETGRAFLQLGYIYARQWRRPGFRARARELLERSRSVFDVTLGTDHPDYARNLEYLANMQEDRETALRLLTQSIGIRRRIMGSNQAALSGSLEALARAYMGLRRFSEAKSCLVEALRIREAAFGPDSMQVGTVLHSLGLAEDGLGAYEQSLAYMKRALAILHKTLGPENQLTLIASMNIGKELLFLRRYSEALPYLRDGLRGGSRLNWEDKDYDPVRKDARFLALVAEEKRLQGLKQAANSAP